jgi:type III restriction enzyme
VEKLSPTLAHPGRALSETESFPFSRPTFEAAKMVFKLVVADNDFERQFARSLQDATDVKSFAKPARRFGYVIEYTDSATNLRYYEPDFVSVDTDGRHYVIEIKGKENVDVAYKDRAVTIWCENVNPSDEGAMVLR